MQPGDVGDAVEAALIITGHGADLEACFFKGGHSARHVRGRGDEQDALPAFLFRQGGHFHRLIMRVGTDAEAGDVQRQAECLL